MPEEMIATSRGRNGAEAPVLPHRTELPALGPVLDMFLIAGLVMLALLFLGQSPLGFFLVLFAWFMPGYWFLVRVMPYIPRLCRHEFRRDVILTGVDLPAFLEVNLKPHVRGAMVAVIVAAVGQAFGALIIALEMSDLYGFSMVILVGLVYIGWVVSLISMAALICMSTIRYLCMPRPYSMAFCWISGFIRMTLTVFGLSMISSLTPFISPIGGVIILFVLAFILASMVKRRIKMLPSYYAQFD